MEFTDKELATILSAKKKVRAATIVRAAILVAMLVGIALMFSGVLIADQFVYISVAAVILAITHPQLGRGPRYEDLVKLLESKSKGQNAKT